jgi:hypothetical protein
MAKIDDLAKEIVRGCSDENGFSGDMQISAYKVARWYLNKTEHLQPHGKCGCWGCIGYGNDYGDKEKIAVSLINAKEFIDKYGKYWIGTGIKLVDEINDILNRSQYNGQTNQETTCI